MSDKMTLLEWTRIHPHRGKCPHCGKVYEFDEATRLLGRAWICMGCPEEEHEDKYGKWTSRPQIKISDLVDVELSKMANEYFR